METLNILTIAFIFLSIAWAFIGCPTNKQDWVKVYNLFFNK